VVPRAEGPKDANPALPFFPLRFDSFSVAGPLMWNSLPAYLRDPVVSRDTFCKYLKTFLFTVY